MQHELGLTHTLPEWLIDDTVDLANARVFVIHATEPSFVGELICGDEEGPDDILGGLTFSRLPGGQVLCRLKFFGRLPTREEAEAMVGSLAESIRQHEAVRYPGEEDV